MPFSRIEPDLYQPVFTDGWAPAITDPDLMGFVILDSETSEVEEDRKSRTNYGPFYSKNEVDYKAHHNHTCDEINKPPQKGILFDIYN